MKVLVIDDNPLHRESARQTLREHDVTIVGTYDEAHKHLEERYAPFDAVEAELKRRGFRSPYEEQDITDEELDASHEERVKIAIELCPPPSFDAVLTDLLMPASKMTMGPDGMRYVGQEMPVGFALALMAVLHGVKYIAVATDLNHHDHPASAMLDGIGSKCPHRYDEYGTPPRFIMNGARVGYYHAPMMRVEGTTCTDCNGTGAKEACACVKRNAGMLDPNCGGCSGTGRVCWSCSSSGKLHGKNWGRMLQHLVEATPLTGHEEKI